MRGKSNIVQIFDINTENLWSSKVYSELKAPIKGLATYGTDILDLKHVIVDESGRLIIDQMT